MTEAEARLAMIYLDAFENRAQWTPEDHMKGLKAVYAAGADAGRRQATEESKR
jgi:hypothetical protein